MLRGQPYPGIVESPGRTVPGTLYLGLDARALLRIDRYEGPPYSRTKVVVTLAGDRHVAAWAYVIPGHLRRLLSDRRWIRPRDVSARLR